MAKWRRAMVTGASAGIGEAIARSLAAQGVDLVLVARRSDRLDALRAELGPRVQVEPLVADLAAPADLARVVARLGANAEPVDLLVNNAGLGSLGPFVDLAPEVAQQQIDVNITALVQLSHAAADHMRASGGGTILNISSVAGNQASPNMAVYCATKAFVTHFSEALAMELRDSGVTVTASCPGLTVSEFHSVAGMAEPAKRPPLLWMTADEVAQDALEAAERGTVVRVNGALNRVTAVVSQSSPRRVRRIGARLVAAKIRPKLH